MPHSVGAVAASKQRQLRRRSAARIGRQNAVGEDPSACLDSTCVGNARPAQIDGSTTYPTDAANLKDRREVRLARYKNLQAPPANTLRQPVG